MTKIVFRAVLLIALLLLLAAIVRADEEQAFIEDVQALQLPAGSAVWYCTKTACGLAMVAPDGGILWDSDPPRWWVDAVSDLKRRTL